MKGCGSVGGGKWSSDTSHRYKNNKIITYTRQVLPSTFLFLEEKLYYCTVTVYRQNNSYR